MSRQSWQEALISADTGGTAVSNTTTATSLLTNNAAHAKFTLPANHFAVGRQLYVLVAGRISNIVTTPGTLTLSLRFGATTVFTSSAMALNTTAKTNVAWTAWILLTCREVGSTANLMGQGEFTSESNVGAAVNTALTAMMPLSAPAVGGTFDSMVSQQVDLFSQFSVANTGNSIQMHQYSLQALN